VLILISCVLVNMNITNTHEIKINTHHQYTLLEIRKSGVTNYNEVPGFSDDWILLDPRVPVK